MSDEAEIDVTPAGAGPGSAERRKTPPRRSPRVEINGWINLDKPVGVASTQAVARIEVSLQRQEGRPCRNLGPARFRRVASRVRRGDQDRPDRAGGNQGLSVRRQVGRGNRHRRRRGQDRRQLAAIARPATRSRRRLPRFVGLISQTPPTFSAIRVAGERAYDLARGGETSRSRRAQIVVHRLELVASRTGRGDNSRPNAARAPMCARSRATSDVRSVATAISSQLRRTRVGPFAADRAAALEALRESPEARARALLPVEAGLAELPRLAIDRHDAAILRRGQKLLLRGAGAPSEGPAYAACFGAPIAFGIVEGGYFVSTRVFNLPG